MSTKVPHFRIFLSSPGDVAHERNIVREVIRELNDDPAIKIYATIEVIAWEVSTEDYLKPATLTPQEAIDANLAKPSETDAVVVIFWERMGTPLDVEKHHTKSDGNLYLSGTEWEYIEAVEGSKKHPLKLPIVLVYRRTDTKPIIEPDLVKLPEIARQVAEQRLQVKKFFDQFRNAETGAYLGNIDEYSGTDDFRTKFKQAAKLLIFELLEVNKNGDLILMRQLRNAASEWSLADKPDYLLWPSERLTDVEKMLEYPGRGDGLRDIEREFIKSEQDRLADKLKEKELNHFERRRIGERLAVIGDTRIGVGIISTSNPQQSILPHIRWGECASQVNGRDLYIAAYPITNLQFKIFTDASKAVFDQHIKVRWDDEANRKPNHPCVEVSWDHATKFCEWLTKEIKETSDYPLPSGIDNRDWVIRLPKLTEWHAGWKKTDDYVLPWGDTDDEYVANTAEAKLKAPIAVGMYPDSASWCGLLDVCGNVREWCLELDNLKAQAIGGSFNTGEARFYKTDWIVAQEMVNDVGFRILLDVYPKGAPNGTNNTGNK